MNSNCQGLQFSHEVLMNLMVPLLMEKFNWRKYINRCLPLYQAVNESPHRTA